MIEFRVTLSLDPTAEALLTRLHEALIQRPIVPPVPPADDAAVLLSEIEAERDQKAAERANRAEADRACVHPAEIGPRAKRNRPGEYPNSPWTAERQALAFKRYPDEGASADLLADINGLPGPPVTAGKLMQWASRNRVRLGPELLRRLQLRNAEAARAALAKRRASPAALRPVATSSLPAAAVPARPPVIAPPPTPRAPAAVAPLPKPVAPPQPKPPAPAPALAGIDARPLNCNGKIEATFAEVRDWAARQRIKYDGGNMDLVNKSRAFLRRAPFVQVAG
jgi:hypothetical protein